MADRVHRPLAGLLVAGTVPGVVLGAVIRTFAIPGPQVFRLIAAPSCSRSDSGGCRFLAQASGADEQRVQGLGADEIVPRSADLATVGPVATAFDAVPIGTAAAAAVDNGGSRSRTPWFVSSTVG